MAEKIYDNISEISKAINGLKKSANEASRATKLLNEDLKLDPSNVELASQRFDALNRELQAYTAYQEKLNAHENALRTAQKKGTAELAQLDKSSTRYAELEKELQRYNTELTKTEKAADKASTQIKRLQAAINGINAKKAADEAEQATKKWQNLEKRADSLQKAAKRLQVGLLLLVGVFVKLTKEAISQSTELYTLSQRYKTSVENIQLYNRALQLATGETDLFTESLKTMSKGLSTIPVGRGVAYNNALKQIGVSYKELADKDPAEQFRIIIESLQEMDNQNLASSAALTLLGESGQTIIGALQSGNEELSYYLEQAQMFAPITTQNAEVLTRMSFQLEAVKSQMQVAAAQIAINLVPMIIQLANILNNTLIPLLTGLSKMGWALYFVVFAILALKVVSTIMKWVIAIKTAEAATRSWTIATIAAKAAALGIIGIIGGVAFGLGKTTQNAKEAQNALNDFATSANDLYGGYASSLGASVEQVYASSNEKTVNITVDIYGEGDMAVSDAAASTIAQLTADEVNRNLGNLIKGN